MAVAVVLATFVGLGAALAADGERGMERTPFLHDFPLRFDSEWIRCSIAADSIEVHGTYVLACSGQMTDRIPLFYPFPQDSLLGGARMVALKGQVGDGGIIPLAWEELGRGIAGVRWTIPPCAGDTIRIEALYRQRAVSGYLRYIVTTTGAWGRPLRHARIDVRLPQGAMSPVFSFPFAQRDLSDPDLWTYEADQFLPDRDIVARWTPRDP